MQLIVGLGNPGTRYERSRHNVGFVVAELVARQLEATTWSFQKKFEAEIATAGSVTLLKPQTYMNKSGESVRAFSDYFDKTELSAQTELPQLFVIHDDLDVPLGKWKLQFGTGPQGHNGLLSLYQHLRTELFWHVRVGIDARQGDRSMPSEAYVLEIMPPDEQRVLDDVMQAIASTLTSQLAS